MTESDSLRFKEGLNNRNLEIIQSVPKADVHNHSGLGMRFEDFQKWCQVELPPPPERMNGIEGMDEYMANVTAPYVNDRKGFEYLLRATLEAAVSDGVTVLETSIDCGWLFDYEEQFEPFEQYIQGCVSEFANRIDFRPEIGVFKGISDGVAERLLRPCLNGSVFKSIDFYGDEKWYQPELTKKYFDIAKAKGIKTKIHVGEFSDAASIHSVLTYLAPDEIQHGITAYEEPKLMDLLKARKVRLNICPSSNVVLGAVKSIETHPIRQLFDYGVTVTVNTDDLLFFHRSVSEEFLWLHEKGVFTADELDVIRLNGLK
jgi:adenosine deaminase